TAALGGACDNDTVSNSEGIKADFLADFVFSRIVDAEFLDHLECLVLEVSADCLGYALGLLFAEADLYGRVPVLAVSRFHLSDGKGRGLEDGTSEDTTLFIEDLGHAVLLGENEFHEK